MAGGPEGGKVARGAIPPPARAQDFVGTRPELPDARVILADAGSTPEEVYARISNGDPLDLMPLCAIRMRERAYLLDLDRILARVQAITAVGACVEQQDRGSLAWLIDKVDRAIWKVLQEDEERERSGIPDLDDCHHLFLVQAFAIERAIARTAAVRFNALDERTRQVFFRLLVEGSDVETCLAEGLGDRKTLREDALRSLCALGYINEKELQQMLTRKKRR